MRKRSSFFLILPVVLLSFFAGCAEKKAESSSIISPENNPNLSLLPIREVLRERLPNYDTLYFSSGQGYEFKNARPNKVIITMDGGPEFFGTRIGRYNDEVLGSRVYDLFLHLYGEYSIFVLEKFDWGRGKQPAPFNDIRERERYTVDNLMENYAEVIREYLSQNDYKTIIIAGFSEGGFIAPELYFRLEGINVSGLIAIAAGGLSPYENFELLLEKLPTRAVPFQIPENVTEDMVKERDSYFEAFYGSVLETYRFEPYPDSPEPFGGPDEPHYPNTFRWLDSFLFRRPIDFYRDIDVPVLFLHGEMDVRVAVESTRYVEEALPGKPFSYRYYPEMWHQPRFYGEFMAIRRDISAWLKAEGL